MSGDVFPQRLRTAREQIRKMSQGELAAAAKLEPTTISHFEAGSRKPSFDNLRKLAVALQVTTDYLLGLSDSHEVSVESDPLFRHGQNMSDKNRKLAEGILELLANSSTNKDKL